MEEAMGTARELAAELALEEGALAVWLAGSHARGDAGPHSDIDLGVIADRDGRGPGYRLAQRDGHLVSVSWTTVEATLRSFENPVVLGAAVPGWRRAIILHDTDGIAAGLVRSATEWRWEAVAKRCDDWAADQVAGFAEEVQKLANSLEAGGELVGAVQRNVLANRLAFGMSVRRRILYDSENRLWDLVSEALGDEWTREQRAAFGLDGETLLASAKGALRLYNLAASEVGGMLDARQRGVVERAVEVAGEIANHTA